MLVSGAQVSLSPEMFERSGSGLQLQDWQADVVLDAIQFIYCIIPGWLMHVTALCLALLSKFLLSRTAIRLQRVSDWHAFCLD